MKRIVLLTLLATQITYAQIGIGNTNPNSTLDISASDMDSPTNKDGLLIPRINNFPITNPTVDQNGMIIFLTSNDTFYFWKNENLIWVPLSENIGNEHYLGEEFDGGIIFYLYNGADGLQHGLIVSKTESTAIWQFPTSIVNADRTDDGAFNTSLMINSPAEVYASNLGNGWYIPSIDELNILYNNRFHVNKALREGGFAILSLDSYWSSTEFSSTLSRAFLLDFFSGEINFTGKNINTLVRGIRAF